VAKCKAVIVYFYAFVSRITEQLPAKLMKIMYLFLLVCEASDFSVSSEYHPTRAAIIRRKYFLKVGK
jgi:hypothetical protein